MTKNDMKFVKIYEYPEDCHNLIYKNKIITRKILPSTISFFKKENIVAGRYDVPVGVSFSDVSIPEHFFIYDIKRDKLNIFKKQGVVLSAVYSLPLCYENNKVYKYTPESDESPWTEVMAIDDGYKMGLSESHRLTIETRADSELFEVPHYLDAGFRMRKVSGNDLRNYIWKYIYYGLSQYSLSDYYFSGLAIPEKDSILHIVGLIRSLKKALEKCERDRMKRDDEDEPSSSLSKLSSADIDQMIKAIDKQIAILESEANSPKKLEVNLVVPDEDSEDGKKTLEPPEVLKVHKDYKLYDFVNIHKLDCLEEFLLYLQLDLEIGLEEDISDLLFGVISESKKIFPNLMGIPFPSSEFNKLFHKILREMSPDEFLSVKEKLCSRVHGLNNRIDEFADYYLDNIDFKIYSEGMENSKKSKLVEVIDASSKEQFDGFRIGWFVYRKETGTIYMAHFEAIPFGKMNERLEIHADIIKDDWRIKYRDGESLAECYYNTIEDKFYISNPYDIPLKSLNDIMKKLQSEDVSFVINNSGADYVDAQDKDDIYSLSKSFSICINETSEIKKYTPKQPYMSYTGYAISNDGGTLDIRRYEFQGRNITESEIYGDYNCTTNEQKTALKNRMYRIRYNVNDKEHIIISASFNLNTIKALCSLFCVDDWTWKSSEENKYGI